MDSTKLRELAMKKRDAELNGPACFSVGTSRLLIMAIIDALTPEQREQMAQILQVNP